jgi:drug/metabolite transporter (DMT)-like permease
VAGSSYLKIHSLRKNRLTAPPLPTAPAGRAAAAAANARLRGIAYMIAGVFAFAIMDALMKALSVRYGAMQIACLRSLSSLVCLLPAILWRRSRGELQITRPILHLVRGMLGILMLASFIYGVRRLSLAQAYSLYLTAPLLMTALSVPAFHERVPPRRWLAILAGLGGVLVILQPWQQGALAFLPAAAIVLSTMCYAVSALLLRSLSRSNGPLSLVFWYLLWVGIGAGVFAARAWLPLQPQDTWRLAGIGIAGALGQLWLTEAFSRAPPSVVGPFEYTALLWAFAIDRIFWSASPATSLIIGGMIVVASGIFVIEDERRLLLETPP